jgi:hypothetical protein
MTPSTADAGFEPLTGRCLCGSVRFSVSAPIRAALYCHCTRCQRRGGAASSITGAVAPGSFAITAGEGSVRTWDPGDGWIKAFCVECGSHTHTISPDDLEQIAVRLPLLEQDPGIRPSARQFVAYALPWEPIPDDGLPRFPERVGAGPPMARDAEPPAVTRA